MTGRVRLVIVVGGLEPGGAERQLAMLLRRSCRAVDAHVCTLDPGGSLEATIAQSATLHQIAGSHLGRLRQLSAIVGAVRPTSVIGWHFYTNGYAALIAKRHRCASIGGLRGSLAHEMALQPKAWRFNLRLPDRIVANSRSARDEVLLHRIGALYVPNAVEPGNPETTRPRAEARREIGIPATDRPVAAFIGHLRPEKRADRFLEALAIARDRDRPWHGVLIGDGPLRETLRAQAALLGLGADDVTFAGHVAEPQRLLGAVDLVAITSDTEGTSNALLEAMAAGVAVLTTRVGELGHQLRSGAEAWVVDCSAEAVAEGLGLGRDDGARTEVARAGAERVRAEHSVETALDAWADVLRVPDRSCEVDRTANEGNNDLCVG